MDEAFHTELAKFRSLRGLLGFWEKILLTAIPVTGVFFVSDGPFYLGLAILREQYLGLFLALILGGVFLSVPPSGRADRHRVPWYDLLFSFLGITVGLYAALFFPEIMRRMGDPDALRLVLGVIAIFLILEALRRTVGWILVGVGVFFLLYARFAHFVPGGFGGTGVAWDRLTNYLYTDVNSLFGLPLAVTATIVLPYIFFGQALFTIGAGQYLTDLAVGVFGRFRGGPAKVAVVASSLFGTISGSAVANVAVDGPITIPLMMRTGYRAPLAAAVEAVASTGGQIMPPVMGAAAFIMAEFLAIPYREVAVAAILPAILYYVALFAQVDLEAGKAGLRGLSRQELPALFPLLGKGWVFFVPLSILVYVLFIQNSDAGDAGMLAALATLALGFLKKELRSHLRWVLETLVSTGRTLLELGVTVALAGLVVGVVQVSGLGFILSHGLVSLAGGNILALLLLTAVVSMILGMGMPTTAVYILLAVLVAPALAQLGIDPLAAHLFIFYFGLVSMITPPICLAAYTAAAIVQADSMRTGLEATRLGIVAYIVPFLFVFSPALLLKGSAVDVSLAAVTAVAGTVLLAVALTGYLFRQIAWPKRVFFSLAALGLLFPHVGPGILFSWVTNAAGLVLAGALLGSEAWGGGFRFRHGTVVSLPASGPALDHDPPDRKKP
ncbi:MAG: TRAP transporter fused permease subunit [Deltaproteobacteria bacterium]|nr:TRAP transporter fused permease subunit [Deltaproteobacteria bacterium]